MSTFSEIHDAPLDQLLRWWDGIDPPLEDFENKGFLDEVAFALTKHRPVGIAVLKRDLYSDQPERRSAVLSWLARPEVADDEVRATLLQAFRSGSRDLRYRALWGFIQLAHFPLERSQVEALLDDEDERMSALTMVYLSRALPTEAVQILRAGLSSPNPRKREYACDEVGDRGISELHDSLRPLLSDPHEDVTAAARSNLGLC